MCLFMAETWHVQQWCLFSVADNLNAKQFSSTLGLRSNKTSGERSRIHATALSLVPAYLHAHMACYDGNPRQHK